MPEKSGRSGTPFIGLKMSGFPELARQYTIAANESISAQRNRNAFQIICACSHDKLPKDQDAVPL